MAKEDNLATWIIDDRVKVPEPLNRHLAAVALQVLSNDISEGYDLALTSHVKPERITLKLGDGSVQVMVSIQKFEIDFKFSNSIVEFGPDYSELVAGSEVRFNKSSATRSSREKKGSLGMDVSLDLDAKFAGSFSGQNNEETETQILRNEQRLYEHIQLDCVSAEAVDGSGVLRGAIISNYKGWKVSPGLQSTSSGVLARMRVAEHWMSFSSPQVQGSGRVLKRLKDMLASTERGEEFRKQAFNSLLERLVFLHLQDPAEKEFATIAASCVALRQQKMAEILTGTDKPALIHLDLRTVERFLELDNQEKVDAFLSDHAALATSVHSSESPKPSGAVDGEKPTVNQSNQTDRNEILESISSPIITIDRSGIILFANNAAKGFLRNPEGSHFLTVLRQPNLLEAIEVALDGQLPAGLVRYSSDDTEYMCNILRAGQHENDASERNSNSALLFVEFLDRSHEQLRRDYVANVSHELRTPLTAIAGFVETLRGPARDDSEARDRFLEILAKESDRAMNLASNLLSLSRAEASENSRPTEMVNVWEVVESSLKRFRDIFPNIVFDARLASKSKGGLATRGDRDQLEQVLNDLVDNAAKYGGDGGRVEISVKRVSNEPRLRQAAVVVEVRDFGRGIDEIHLPRLTERFYRVDNHRSKELGGTGLGLALVKHIINRHRGRLKIESSKGKGTTVSVLLPAEENSKADNL